MNHLPSGTVTFLFTDIESSTKLASEHPDTWESARSRHHAILRAAIELHNGHVFQIIGDSFCAAFHTAGDALRAAVKAQYDLHHEKWPDGLIKVRMGIHTGRAEMQENREYHGYAALSRVQRVMSAGHGGQILLTLATQELVHEELPDGIQLRDLGEWQLKDVIRPMRLYQILMEGLPADFAPLQAAPALVSAEVTTTSLLDRIVRGKLIGRERELMDAHLCWQKTIAGEGQVLLISGEPGVGKTRFTRELVEQLRNSSATVLTGECYAEGGAPYAPIAQIIQDAFAQNPALPNTLPQYVLADILTLAPALRVRYADAPINQPLDTESEQERIYDSMLELCARLSFRVPLMLFLDDAHWADPGTLSLLRHLARRSRAGLQTARLRLMIVITYREVELDEARALNEVLLDLNRERIATRIKLTRLSRERTHHMLNVMFAEEITPEFLDGIYHETEGNPFFIEEVCKALIESGKLTYSEGRWHRPGMDDMQIPQSLRLAIQARVGRLQPQAQEALTLASVIGREFDFDTLLYSSEPQDEDLLIESLESATRAQLIEEVKGKSGERYSFAHALIPTTLYEGISSRRRKRMHKRVAGAIEKLSPNDTESLAYHFSAADEAGKAVEYSRRAARRAEALYAYDAAIQHLRAALDFVEADQPGLRRELLEQLADILSHIHEGVEAIPLYREIISSLDPKDDPTDEIKIRLHRKIINAIPRMNRWDDIQRFEADLKEHEAEGFKLIENRPPQIETIRFLTELSYTAWLHRIPQDWDSAETYARNTVALAEQLGEPMELAEALNALSNAYGGRGLFRERVELELRRLGLIRDPRFTDTNKRVDVLNQAGAVLVYVGEYARAMPHLVEAERLASQTRDVDQLLSVLRVQSHCLYLTDQWDELIKIEAKWRALERQYPKFFRVVFGSCFQIALNASVHARRGEMEQAASLREEARLLMIGVDGTEERFGRDSYY
ncbi:MAG TPA: AAA family ATPase [Anaerolineales bacterium]|nr:AAA family ATPase [Anaerolineales bacterium]